jgi:hypothetical protein
METPSVNFKHLLDLTITKELFRKNATAGPMAEIKLAIPVQCSNQQKYRDWNIALY